MEGAGAGTTVLVVDDDASLRLLCRVNLELEGYRVLEAATLEDAANAVATEAVGVILLDVHVGAGDGRAFLRELRDSKTNVRVALFTGSSKLEDDDRRIADGILSKPFALEDLTSTVRRLAQRVDSAA
jgi:DNA-binding response OmpR family regulator